MLKEDDDFLEEMYDDDDFDYDDFVIEELEGEIALLEMINGKVIEENDKLKEQIGQFSCNIEEALSDIKILVHDIERNKHRGCHAASILSSLSRITDDLNGEVSYENHMKAIGL